MNLTLLLGYYIWNSNRYCHTVIFRQITETIWNDNWIRYKNSNLHKFIAYTQKEIGKIRADELRLSEKVQECSRLDWILQPLQTFSIYFFDAMVNTKVEGIFWQNEWYEIVKNTRLQARQRKEMTKHSEIDESNSRCEVGIGETKKILQRIRLYLLLQNRCTY